MSRRRLFDKLLQQNIGYFADRHSSEFIARLTTGAAAVSQVINLLITAIGRDLMSLIGLTIVMVVQDPVMTLIGFVAAPPAFFFLRKLIRRVRNIARIQFTGGTRIIETMQEALQGLRMVKAFALEDEMRRRLDRSVADVQHESNKMARVSNRASPLMEMLGGVTVALAQGWPLRIVLPAAAQGAIAGACPTRCERRIGSGSTRRLAPRSRATNAMIQEGLDGCGRGALQRRPRKGLKIVRRKHQATGREPAAD
jgi:ATP-binding cassette, subfamily B, bacterial MsbA